MNNQRIRFGLHLKSIIAVTLIIIGVASALSFYFIRHEKKVIKDTLVQRGLTLAASLAFNSEYAILTLNKNLLSNLIEGVMKQPDVAYCLITDASGTILAKKGLNERLMYVAPLKTQTSNTTHTVDYYNDQTGHFYFNISVPVVWKEIITPQKKSFKKDKKTSQDKNNIKKSVIGVVNIGISLDNAFRLAHRNQNIAAIITAIIILFGILISAILTGIVLSPIRKLVEGTEQIAKGDLKFKVSVKANDEIAHLANSFNIMTEDLAKSHNELLKAKEYTENIIRSMLDILFVTDPKGIIQLVNAATLTQLGYSREELIGQPIDMLFTSKTHEDMDEKNPFLSHENMSGIEMELITKTKEKISFLVSGAVMHDSSGNREGLVSIAKNITERKQVEEALKKSNARFNTLADNIPGMIYQFVRYKDGSTYFPYVSSGCSELFGYEPTVFQKHAHLILDMLHHEDAESFYDTLKQSATRLWPWHWEGRFIINNEIKWIQTVSRPTKLVDDSVMWEGVLMDVSERKFAQSSNELKTILLEEANADLRANEKKLKTSLVELEKTHEELQKTQFHLLQSEKLKIVGRLASGVAHEVKNPLAIIMQGVHYLSTKLPQDNEILHQVLVDINTAINRADSVIKGVLDFSSLSQLEMEPCDINELLESVLLLVKHELNQHHIGIEKEFQADIPKVKVDKNKMDQVFINIFMNSIQAMENNGTITIRTFARELSRNDHGVGKRNADIFAEGDSVVFVEIYDQGSGIPENKIDKIFEPFFTTKGGEGGTGLGLSIINNIVQLHKGLIRLENSQEGGIKTTVMLSAIKI